MASVASSSATRRCMVIFVLVYIYAVFLLDFGCIACGFFIVRGYTVFTLCDDYLKKSVQCSILPRFSVKSFSSSSIHFVKYGWDSEIVMSEKK